MKVLYLTDPEPDYLADQIYDGLCETLDWRNVIDFPRKALYHEPGARASYRAQNPGHDLTTENVASMICERRIDLTIVSSPRHGALEAFRSLGGLSSPVVLLDGEDDGCIRADLAGSVPAA